MELTRRDFLRGMSAVAAALGLKLSGVWSAEQRASAPAVVWLQAQGCSGCSVSLLNTVYYMTADELLLETISLEYHPTLMAAAGAQAVGTAEAALSAQGYVLVLEGAVPTAAGGAYCYLWPGMTALAGVQAFAQRAAFILAVGTCSAYGGMVAGRPNPTGVRALRDLVAGRQVINIPGCPAHPDWVVGTVAWLIKYGTAPELDGEQRPKLFFKDKIHGKCPYKDNKSLCLEPYGCCGKKTAADCWLRKWNSAGEGQFGLNWCIGAGCPCHGCTEPGFPDSMSPFYEKQKGTWTAPQTSQPIQLRASREPQTPPMPQAEGAEATEASGVGPTPWEQQQLERRQTYEETMKQRRRAYEEMMKQRRRLAEQHPAGGAHGPSGKPTGPKGAKPLPY